MFENFSDALFAAATSGARSGRRTDAGDARMAGLGMIRELLRSAQKLPSGSTHYGQRMPGWQTGTTCARASAV